MSSTSHSHAGSRVTIRRIEGTTLVEIAVDSPNGKRAVGQFERGQARRIAEDIQRAAQPTRQEGSSS